MTVSHTQTNPCGEAQMRTENKGSSARFPKHKEQKKTKQTTTTNKKAGNQDIHPQHTTACSTLLKLQCFFMGVEMGLLLPVAFHLSISPGRRWAARFQEPPVG